MKTKTRTRILCETLAMIMLCQLGYAAQETAFDGRQKLASANIGFAFKLLRQIVQDQPGTNVVISPYGASTVLQMVCNGAAGQTKAEMERVLGTFGMRQEALAVPPPGGLDCPAETGTTNLDP